MRGVTAMHGLDRKRSRSRRNTAAPIQARQTVEEAQVPAGSWAKTVKGTLKRWTTSGSDSTGPSAAQQRGQTSKKGTTKQRRSLGQKSRTGKQTSGETRSGVAHDNSGKPGRFYWNITGFPFPLGPLLSRRTIRYEVSFQDSAPCIAKVSNGISCRLKAVHICISASLTACPSEYFQVRDRGEIHGKVSLLVKAPVYAAGGAGEHVGV